MVLTSKRLRNKYEKLCINIADSISNMNKKRYDLLIKKIVPEYDINITNKRSKNKYEKLFRDIAICIADPKQEKRLNLLIKKLKPKQQKGGEGNKEILEEFINKYKPFEPYNCEYDKTQNEQPKQEAYPEHEVFQMPDGTHLHGVSVVNKVDGNDLITKTFNAINKFNPETYIVIKNKVITYYKNKDNGAMKSDGKFHKIKKDAREYIKSMMYESDIDNILYLSRILCVLTRGIYNDKDLYTIIIEKNSEPNRFLEIFQKFFIENKSINNQADINFITIYAFNNGAIQVLDFLYDKGLLQKDGDNIISKKISSNINLLYYGSINTIRNIYNWVKSKCHDFTDNIFDCMYDTLFIDVYQDEFRDFVKLCAQDCIDNISLFKFPLHKLKVYLSLKIASISHIKNNYLPEGTKAAINSVMRQQPTKTVHSCKNPDLLNKMNKFIKSKR